MNYLRKDTLQQVAVVGIGCRLPGNVSTVEQFWDLLQSGRNGFSESSNRFNADGFYHPDRNKRNATPNKGAHYLSQDITAFDASFFNITYAEALAMDPQQRMALEVAYEAFENAGLTMDRLSNSKTGCFIGASTNDWQTMMTRDAELGLPYLITGANPEFLSNRISWFFNLKGPSMTINTACSSSLVSLHLAFQSLQTGESSMAIVGGVNALLTPGTFTALASQGFLSPDGHSKSFDASADGYGRGEGCGIVVLKRLDDALADNDYIRAVICGTGVNSDGFTQGITMPSTAAQAALIQDVYVTCGMNPADTQYAEAHGTGTKVGDPAELQALSEAIAAHARDGQKLIVGSVKPNIGHLEAAAGIAGLIKGILALEKGLIPPNNLLHTVNPEINLEKWKIHIPTTLTHWPTCDTRRLSINSFGVGGTNAHAIVEDAIKYHRSSLNINPTISEGGGSKFVSTKKKRIYVISANDEAGISRLCLSLAQHFKFIVSKLSQENEVQLLSNLAYTLGLKRSKLSWKSFLTASSLEELSLNLDGANIAPKVRSHDPPRIGYVFTGQGAQWARMGIELCSYPVFLNSIQESDQCLQDLKCQWSSLEELHRPEGLSNINHTEYSQPLCTIVQMALVDLLNSWGVHPQKVIGHSSGEIAAAYCIGALSKKDAVSLAYHRGLSAAQLRSIAPGLEGGMLVIGCSLDQAHALISEVHDGTIMVACVNSPRSVTISGDVIGLEQLESLLDRNSVFTRRLQVEIAYHSQHMHRVAAVYEEAINKTVNKPPLMKDQILVCPGHPDNQAVMISSVRAMRIELSDIKPSYWVQNLVAPVLFSDALVELLLPMGPKGRPKTSEVDILIELGPHSALKSPIEQILEFNSIKQVSYEAIITRGNAGDDTAMILAGRLWSQGYPIDISKVNNDLDCQMLVDLPVYPWNYSHRYCPYPRIVEEYLGRKHPRKGLLGAPVSSYGSDEKVWSGYLRLSEEPWLRDHVIQSSIVLPGSAYIVMALEAARQLADPGKIVKSFKLRQFEICGATVLSDGVDIETAVQFRPHLLGILDTSEPAWWEFSIASCATGENGLRLNCRGLLLINYEMQRFESIMEDEKEFNTALIERERLATSHTKDFAVDIFYAMLRSVGLQFGDKFRNITHLKIGPGICCYDVAIPDPGNMYSSTQNERPYIIHPTTLDAFFQGISGAMFSDNRKQSTVPKSIDELEIYTRINSVVGTQFHGYCNAKWHGMRDIIADVGILDGNCSLKVFSMKGYRSTEISNSINQMVVESKVPRTICFTEQWEPSLELLTACELESLLGQANGTDQATLEYLKLRLHQYPHTSILEIQDGTLPLLTTVAPNDLKTQMTEYTVSVQENDVGLAACILPQQVEILPHNLRVELPLDLPRFNVLVVRHLWNITDSTEATEILLKNIKSLTAPGATILLEVSQLNSQLTRQLALRYGLIIHCQVNKGDTMLFLCTFVPIRANDVQIETQEIYLIEPDNFSTSFSSFSSELNRRLEHQSQSMNVVTLRWSTESLRHAQGNRCIVLVELEKPILENLGAEDFSIIQQLLSKTSNLLWVTGIDGPGSNIVTGMLRTIRNESPECSHQVIHLSSATPLADIADLLSRVIVSGSREYELREVGGLLKIPRIYQDTRLDSSLQRLITEEISNMSIGEGTQPLRLGIANVGQLGSLYFEPDDGASLPLGEHEIEIATKASGMNFRDVMTTMGLLPDPLIGLEASGIVTRIGSGVARVRVGDRVCTMTSGAHATHVRALEHLCEPIPDFITFEEAASIAVVHCTAYHALVNLARLRKGQSVLIHAGAGGVGQAAIQLAKHIGLVIYTTVGSTEKRQLLKEAYNIPDEHIFSSRDSSFVQGIMRMTGGRGVDCVLNSLAGELLRQGWYCVAPFGIFIEIGMRDIIGNMRLDMRPFQKHATFTFFSLLEVIAEAPPPFDRLLPETFANLRKGIIRPPTPLLIYPVHAHQEAFRLMQTGKHRGKVVLSYGGENEVPVLHRPRDRLKLDSKATYLLVGGLGGLGRSLARMMVDSGAHNIAFISRSGVGSTNAQRLCEELTEKGCLVNAYECDVSDNVSLKTVLHQCSLQMPPIQGVVQLAMVLQDGAFETMTHEQWIKCTKPKIQGTLNLDKAFKKDLEFFIILSSVAGVFGNRGQANYAAACTYQDALAASRRQKGLKAVSIDLGIMREVGVLAEQGASGDVKQWEESLGISEVEFHGLIKTVIHEQANGSFSTASSVITGLPTACLLQNAKLSRPTYFNDPRFSHISKLSGSGDEELPKDRSTLEAQLSTAKTVEAAAEIITNALVDKVAEILQVPVSEIDTDRSLYTFGIDSLVAMEIRSWIVRDMKADVALFDVLAAISLSKFALQIAEKSKLVIRN